MAHRTKRQSLLARLLSSGAQGAITAASKEKVQDNAPADRGRLVPVSDSARLRARPVSDPASTQDLHASACNLMSALPALPIRNRSDARRSFPFPPLVAQVGNLLYRRLAACRATIAAGGCSLVLLCSVSPAPLLAQEPLKRDPVRVDEKTEAVIKGALRWLAAKQLPNGAWGSTDEEQRHPTAITGYVLMAYQAAGHLPGEGEFGKNVSAGLQYLLDATAPDGIIGNRNNGQYMYGHGIASIALAELYGHNRNPVMKQKLDKIIKLIVASQNVEGGWRYRPIARDADISVTVLQVTALRAAKNAGIDVPQSTIDNAVKYVKRCFHPPSGGFTYQPNREPGFARTAAAIYSLQVCGLYEDEMVKRGSEYLIKNIKQSDQWFTYGNFYAAPAQYMIGGDTWQKWYGELKTILMQNVSSRGDQYYWDTKLDQGKSVGQIYCTAVYTMILAMPYHYIPLYQR